MASSASAARSAVEAVPARAHGLGVEAGMFVGPARPGRCDASGDDGPAVASPQYAAGFWIIDAPSAEVARELAAQGSRACNRIVEVRAFLAG
jgi:hypothetical protein